MEGYELKAYERFKEQAQFYRQRAYDLEAEKRVTGPDLFRAHQTIGRLEQRVEKLEAENARLKQRLEEVLAQQASGDVEDKPAVVVKASVKRHRRKRPGRKAGHAAALRPMPDHIDMDQTVPLPVDDSGRDACPWCKTGLVDVEDREHIVEDIVPAKVMVTCYHNRSGWCPCCRKQVESRALEQPPAANLPHGQVGINALATAMLLRIVYRLPFRQIKQLFLDLPQFSISPAAVADQVQRVARWLEGDYEQLILKLRCAKVVHADETGWRTEGKNGWLWTATSPTHTLFHVDPSRGGKVIVDLLGKAFGGTLVSDFHSAYSKIDCKKQKCLCHLLRELTESAEKSPAFKTGPFFRQAKRLFKQSLALKSRWDQLDDNTYTTRACALEDKLDRLLQNSYDEPNAKRLAKRMRKYRKELMAFLWDKDVPGTNNAAERALRPAVVARKISGGSRSDNGAEAWAKLASLLRSTGQQGQRMLETIKAMLTAAWAAEKPPTILIDTT
jgi:transposase-like protein